MISRQHLKPFTSCIAAVCNQPCARYPSCGTLLSDNDQWHSIIRGKDIDFLHDVEFRKWVEYFEHEKFKSLIFRESLPVDGKFLGSRSVRAKINRFSSLQKH